MFCKVWESLRMAGPVSDYPVGGYDSGECEQQERSLSWIIQRAWKIARGEIMKTPSVKD